MKVRSDFVTNSSSSSYIVAYRGIPKYSEEELEKYPELALVSELLEAALLACGDEWDDTTPGDVVKTKDELNAYIIDRYGWRGCETIDDFLSDEDWWTSKVNDCYEAIDEGYNIVFKEVDYNDGTAADLIKRLTKIPRYAKLISED